VIHEVNGWEEDDDFDNGDPYCDCGAMPTTDEVMCDACGKPVFENMPKERKRRASKTGDLFDSPSSDATQS
jgi:hypothetical protein